MQLGIKDKFASTSICLHANLDKSSWMKDGEEEDSFLPIQIKAAISGISS
jgi:hypothetical protein